MNEKRRKNELLEEMTTSFIAVLSFNSLRLLSCAPGLFSFIWFPRVLA